MPSFREMADHLEQKTPAPAFAISTRLIAKGYLSKDPGRHRSIIIEKHPDGRPFQQDRFPGMRVVETNAVPENEIWVRAVAALNRVAG